MLKEVIHTVYVISYKQLVKVYFGYTINLRYNKQIEALNLTSSFYQSFLLNNLISKEITTLEHNNQFLKPRILYYQISYKFRFNPLM